MSRAGPRARGLRGGVPRARAGGRAAAGGGAAHDRSARAERGRPRARVRRRPARRAPVSGRAIRDGDAQAGGGPARRSRLRRRARDAGIARRGQSLARRDAGRACLDRRLAPQRGGQATRRERPDAPAVPRRGAAGAAFRRARLPSVRPRRRRVEGGCAGDRRARSGHRRRSDTERRRRRLLGTRREHAARGGHGRLHRDDVVAGERECRPGARARGSAARAVRDAGRATVARRARTGRRCARARRDRGSGGDRRGGGRPPLAPPRPGLRLPDGQRDGDQEQAARGVGVRSRVCCDAARVPGAGGARGSRAADRRGSRRDSGGDRAPASRSDPARPPRCGRPRVRHRSSRLGERGARLRTGVRAGDRRQAGRSTGRTSVALEPSKHAVPSPQRPAGRRSRASRARAPAGSTVARSQDPRGRSAP